MTFESSYGIIPLQKKGEEWRVLLIQHSSALYWGFPKGHAEAGESPKDAAVRELKEETNLEVVNFLLDSQFEEHYVFTLHGKLINKTVYYYLGEVAGQLSLQQKEVSDSQWLPLARAVNQLTYDTDKTILRSVIKHLVHHNY